MNKTIERPATDAVDLDRLVRILRSYRMQYTYDKFGDGKRLEDALTPPDQSTVRLGIEEIKLLADYILGEINYANVEMTSGADSNQSKENLYEN